MRRTAILLGPVSVVLAIPAPAGATTYCSPTGDYCHGAVNRGGVVRIMLETFSFRRRVQVCVTGPASTATCRCFRLRRRDAGTYGFNVRWSAHFPNERRGRYTVRFRYDGATLGPRAIFRR